MRFKDIFRSLPTFLLFLTEYEDTTESNAYKFSQKASKIAEILAADEGVPNWLIYIGIALIVFVIIGFVSWRFSRDKNSDLSLIHI